MRVVGLERLGVARRCRAHPDGRRRRGSASSHLRHRLGPRRVVLPRRNPAAAAARPRRVLRRVARRRLRLDHRQGQPRRGDAVDVCAHPRRCDAPALAARVRDVWRGPAAGREDGRGGGGGDAAARRRGRDPGACGGVHEALCGLLGAAERARPRGRVAVSARAGADLPAALPGRGGRRRTERDGELPGGERRARGWLGGAAAGAAARADGFRRAARDGLARGRQPARLSSRGELAGGGGASRHRRLELARHVDGAYRRVLLRADGAAARARSHRRGAARRVGAACAPPQGVAGPAPAAARRPPRPVVAQRGDGAARRERGQRLGRRTRPRGCARHRHAAQERAAVCWAPAAVAAAATLASAAAAADELRWHQRHRHQRHGRGRRRRRGGQCGGVRRVPRRGGGRVRLDGGVAVPACRPGPRRRRC
mmetsp:Transcript_21709/g.68106  ORF Transcript_21709/g.68106 Transcript_21709/m.68106 type:complete len:426 (+) Transcript_21709:224-1501(+)